MKNKNEKQNRKIKKIKEKLKTKIEKWKIKNKKLKTKNKKWKKNEDSPPKKVIGFHTICWVMHIPQAGACASFSPC